MSQTETPKKEIVLSLSKKKGDFTITACRSSGPGGQNVNKRATKVRIKHPASGAVGESQTHKAQAMNRKEAFKRLVGSQKFQTWLRITLAERGLPEANNSHGEPTGNRGQKVRTYNMIRDEVIDHRSNLKIRGVKNILDGDLDEIIISLQRMRKEDELQSDSRKHDPAE